MVWSLVRLTESGDGRWWLAAGLFAGLSLLSKLTALMLLPAIALFMLVPDWRWRWLRSPYPWAVALFALVVFSPVLIWNADARLGLVQVSVRSRRRNACRHVAHAWRLYRPSVRPGRADPAACGAVRCDAHGMARISLLQCGFRAAVDGRAGAVRVFPLEIADPAGWRHLADVHLAVGLRGSGYRPRGAIPRKLAGVDGKVLIFWAKAAIASGLSLSPRSFCITSSARGISLARPIRSAAKPASNRSRAALRANCKTPARPGSRPTITASTRCCVGISGSRAGDPDQRTQPLQGLPRSGSRRDRRAHRALCRSEAVDVSIWHRPLWCSRRSVRFSVSGVAR